LLGRGKRKHHKPISLMAYDENDENRPDPNRRQAGTPTWWLASRGSNPWYQQ
jgi:hypothetical protein